LKDESVDIGMYEMCAICAGHCTDVWFGDDEIQFLRKKRIEMVRAHMYTFHCMFRVRRSVRIIPRVVISTTITTWR
jgi:hypothetical protein